MTKPIVTVAAMILVEEGKLSARRSGVALHPGLRRHQGRRLRRRSRRHGRDRAGAAGPADDGAGPDAPHLGPDLRRGRRQPGEAVLYRHEGDRRATRRWRRWPTSSPSCRCSTSRARPGSIRCRPTCWAASSRSPRACRSTSSSRSASPSRSRWATPPSRSAPTRRPGRPAA